MYESTKLELSVEGSNLFSITFDVQKDVYVIRKRDDEMPIATVSKYAFNWVDVDA